MSTSKTMCAVSLCGFVFAGAGQAPDLGRPLTSAEIRKIDITIAPDGQGLPPGNGSVSTGEKVFEEKCEGCHGARGVGDPMEKLTGGIGSLASANPVKTPVSYWPNATTIFDYIRRAMPIVAPRSLSNDEAYALTAYLLSIDGVVSKEAVLDAKSLPQIKMPNRDGFVSWWPEHKQ